MKNAPLQTSLIPSDTTPAAGQGQNSAQSAIFSLRDVFIHSLKEAQEGG
jgi:hypothetical protein